MSNIERVAKTVRRAVPEQVLEEILSSQSNLSAVACTRTLLHFVTYGSTPNPLMLNRVLEYFAQSA